MKILVVGSPKLPIPPTLGGGVPILLYNGLLLPNEKSGEACFHIVCPFDEKAMELSKNFHNSNWHFVHIPKIIRGLDSFLCVILKFLKVKRTLSVSFIFRTIWYIRKVKKILKQNDFDRYVIENSIPVLRCFLPKTIREKTKGKLYFHSHAAIRRFFGTKKVFLSCKKIFVVSGFMKQDLLTIKGMDSIKSKIEVIYNKLTLECFEKCNSTMDKNAIRKSFGVEETDFLLIFVGRICKDKGVDILIESLSLLPKQVKLLIVGSNFFNSSTTNSFIDSLKGKSSCLKDRVKFTGFIESNLLYNLYHCADIAVLPSVWEEPAGQTMVEAIASGIPLITTRSGGIPEYMGEGNCILLNLSQNLPADIAGQVSFLMEHPVLAKEIAHKGYIRSKKFGIETYLPDFLGRLNDQ